MLKYNKEKIINVLIVEDNPVDARLVAELLKEAREITFNLDYAATLSAAIDAVASKIFDIALLDLSLPDSIGLETFSKLHHNSPHLPIIILTGLDNEELATKVVREGAQDYLVKGDIGSRLLVRAIRYSIERRGLEDRLIKSEKMQAIGHLAAGISHDFNNILMMITSHVEMLQMELQRINCFDQYVEKPLARIIASTEKAANLIQGLHAIGGKDSMDPKIVNLNEIIKKFEKFIVMLIGKKNISLSVKTADRDLNVIADRTQIEQVLMNLAINAKDAMQDGGNLSIGTDFIESAEEIVDEPALFNDRKFAVLSVSDTGHGIDQKIIDKIFEPFFTTKGEGKGTGLGLSMVYGIIKQHNGYINCHSAPDKGATFNIYLPLAN